MQVARSSDGGLSWGAFELIRFEGADALNVSKTRTNGRDRGKKLHEYNGWHLKNIVAIFFYDRIVIAYCFFEFRLLHEKDVSYI